MYIDRLSNATFIHFSAAVTVFILIQPHWDLALATHSMFLENTAFTPITKFPKLISLVISLTAAASCYIHWPYKIQSCDKDAAVQVRIHLTAIQWKWPEYRIRLGVQYEENMRKNICIGCKNVKILAIIHLSTFTLCLVRVNMLIITCQHLNLTKWNVSTATQIPQRYMLILLSRFTLAFAIRYGRCGKTNQFGSILHITKVLLLSAVSWEQVRWWLQINLWHSELIF